jgi:plastocyanin
MGFMRAWLGAALMAAVLAASAGSTSATAQDQPAVSIVDGPQRADYTFNPESLQVQVGDTVTWTNNGDVAHTVTADDGSVDSGDLQSGDTFSYTFDTPGTFSYLCTPHPWMTGTIVVVGG